MRLLKIRENIGADLGGRDRPAEEEALGLVAVGLVEKGRLRGGLDAFDRHPHVQLASERDDRLHHRLGITAGAFEALHEAAVDLDLVEREAPQIAQARIAGTEIVHHDRHAHRLERLQLRHDGFRIAEQQGLGDLQLEPVRREARLLRAPRRRWR